MASGRLALVVYGATGYTGRQVVRYLLELDPLEVGSWAVAGRSRERLETLVAEAPPDRRPSLLLANGEDPASLRAMAARSRVLVNLGGPYAQHGRALYEACVEQGTHYVDVCGETEFVRDMVRSFHTKAREKRLKLVPCAGYESLAFDLATRFAASALRERKLGDCVEVDLLTSMQFRGGMPVFPFSGGTVATMKSWLDHAESADVLLDPFCLVDETDVDAATRERNAYDLSARYDRRSRVWCAPVVPGPFLNPAVVHRSNALLAERGEGYGPGFAYREATNVSALAPLPLAQPAVAHMLAGWVRGVISTLRSPRAADRRAASAMLDRFGPSSGEGPEALLDTTDYRLDVRARAASGGSVRARVRARGHPGYRSTANLVAEAGLALAHDADRLPQIYGVVTPATGLGLELLPRLERAGMRFDVLGA